MFWVMAAAMVVLVAVAMLRPFLGRGAASAVAMLGLLIPVGAIFLGLLVGFGLMEFIGVMVQPIMRPVFKTPGRSAIDAVASFVGSYSLGLLITNRVYKEGRYSAQEAAIIATHGFTSDGGWGGTMRQPSAALVNYAQRADLLLDVAALIGVSYMSCFRTAGPECHAVFAALKGDEQMERVQSELLQGYVDFYRALLAPYAKVDDEELLELVELLLQFRLIVGVDHAVDNANQRSDNQQRDHWPHGLAKTILEFAKARARRPVVLPRLLVASAAEGVLDELIGDLREDQGDGDGDQA